MPATDPEERAMIARIASAERWAHVEDRVRATGPARAGLRAKFEREVDPQCSLSAAERERRVEHLMRAHMLRMSLLAAQARSRARRALELAAECGELKAQAASDPLAPE